MTLTVTPNPVKIGNGIAIVGAGFTPNVQTRIHLDNTTVETFISEPDGSFAVGAIVSTTPKTQIVLVQQFTANAWHNLGSVSVSVVGAGPTISQVLASAIMQNGATISWTLSEPSTGQVEYGLTTSYGNLSTPETSFNYSAHIQKLSGLAAGTLYHFRVKSTNKAGGTSVSGDFTFTTLPVGGSVPPAPSLTATVGTTVGIASDNLVWTGGTNVATYRVYRDGILIASPVSPNYTDTDVVSGTTYSYQVSAVNATGEGPKSNAVSVTPVIVQPVPPPQTPLQIIALAANPTADGAVISWQLSANATGKVAYGPTSSYGSFTSNDGLTASHSKTITGQAASSVVHFQVISTDANNNTVTSSDATFTVLDATIPPPPPPPSTGRPWPLPVVSNTVSVPSSIDKTGATDVTAALNSFLNGVANGSTINFPAAPAVYKISSCLDLRGKNNWIIEGNGCTLNNVANANSQEPNTSSFWATQIPTVHSGAASSHITIRNFTAKGASPAPGTFQSGEFAAFLHVYANPAETYSTSTGCYFEVSGIIGSGFFGDLVTLNQAANYAWIHDNNCANIGRNGVSVVWGQNILIESNNFGKVGYCVFDIEPESGSSGSPCAYITFRNNTADSWGNCYLAGVGGAGTDIHDVLIDGNTIKNSSLLTIITLARRENITFTNNVSQHTASGPVLQFAHVDGLTVQHNTQPLSSGSLVSISDCPGAVITPNP